MNWAIWLRGCGVISAGGVKVIELKKINFKIFKKDEKCSGNVGRSPGIDEMRRVVWSCARLRKVVKAKPSQKSQNEGRSPEIAKNEANFTCFLFKMN